MMDLLDRLDAIQARDAEIRDRERAELQENKFRGVAQALEDLARSVLEVRKIEQHLGDARKGKAVAWTGVLESLAKLEADVAADGGIDIRELKARCERSGQALKESCQSDWREWVEKHKAVQLAPEVLRRLRELDEGAVDELERLQDERGNLSRQAHPGEGDVERVRTQGLRVANALAKLGFDDDEVQKGFQLLVAGGVGLDELSNKDSKLRKWLDNKGLLASCKVTL